MEEKKARLNGKLLFKNQPIKNIKKPREKIDKSLKFLRMNPFNDALHFRKIQGRGHFYRIRVGDYRIVYTLKRSVLIILIIRIGHRKDIYRFFLNCLKNNL